MKIHVPLTFGRTLRQVGPLVVALLAMAVSPLPTKAQLTFNYTYSGESFDNTAQAAGWITFKAGLPANPASSTIYSANAGDILALSITVSGASSGNGTFSLSDFDPDQTVYWSTSDATLNLSQELVGQPAGASTWGTPDGSSGDFNLFNATSTPTAPDGTTYFTLTTNAGGGDNMLLTSFVVPEPSTWVISGVLGAVAVAVVQWRRRSA